MNFSNTETYKYITLLLSVLLLMLVIGGVYYYSKTKQAKLSKSDVTLNKLGNEIHSPTDMMKINPDHILFIEDLSQDSKVLSAIKNHTSR